MDISFTLGSIEEVDNLRILQSCNGLLLCSGSVSLAFGYIYNPCTNLFKRLSQLENSHDDSHFCITIVLRMAFDLTKSLNYKVVQVVGRINSDLEIQVYSSQRGNWSLCKDWHVMLYKLNTEDHDHPIITTIEIPYGLHRGRNFLQSFGGSDGSDNPMLVLIDIPSILHLEGIFFESCGCLLLVRRDDISSREFTIYEMMKGCSMWTVSYESLRQLETGTFTSTFKFPALKQIAIKRWDEYGFVIRPGLVGVTCKSVRIDL
nr:hypothetical protein [Tanacetum cinerariifolium]